MYYSIINVLESWNLNGKITGVSHDNAANISNAVVELHHAIYQP